MNEGFKYAGWTLVGGAVGAFVAYLTAPASGNETRRRLARSVEDERDALLRKSQRAIHHAADYLEDQLKQGRRKLADVVSLSH
jgi:gas vesicle protein